MWLDWIFLEWDLINRQERVVRTSCEDVTLFDRHLTVPHDLHNYPFAKFAQSYFKVFIFSHFIFYIVFLFAFNFSVQLYVCKALCTSLDMHIY